MFQSLVTLHREPEFVTRLTGSKGSGGEQQDELHAPCDSHGFSKASTRPAGLRVLAPARGGRDLPASGPSRAGTGTPVQGIASSRQSSRRDAGARGALYRRPFQALCLAGLPPQR